MNSNSITQEELQAYNYLMSWTDAAKDLNRELLNKLRDQMIDVLEGRAQSSMINYANRKEDVMKYTQYGLLVINKTIELLDAIDLRTEAAKDAKDSLLAAVLMWTTMNRPNDGN